MIYSGYLKKPCIIKELLQSESIVRLGDPIIVYEVEDEYILIEETKTVKAPKDGIVFYAEEKENTAEQGDKYLTVYVVSFFDEYNDFCKWYAGK